MVLVTHLVKGFSGRVYALATFNDGTGSKLYAGGSFTKSGSTDLLRLACWDGSSWSPVGGGTNGTVYALAAHNDGFGNALFVGGQFTWLVAHQFQILPGGMAEHGTHFLAS